MTRRLQWVVLVCAFVLAFTACAWLVESWLSWSGGAWADCPNYAFGLHWYPNPPLIVTMVPIGISLAAITMFLRAWRGFVSVVGLTVAAVPVVTAVAIPIVSDVLGASTVGC